MIGALLEFCPPDPMPTGKPFQGRKLISFTDSRQGTARIAVKLQQDSERNRIRGLIYQRLLQAHPVNSLAGNPVQGEHDVKRAKATRGAGCGWIHSVLNAVARFLP
ncbi:hypothetical protein D9M69_404240 [compost metagenome]